jgi:hypothetical protein
VVRHLATIAVPLVVGAIAVAGCGEGNGGESGSPEKQARDYISQKGHAINVGRVDYEHIAALVALAGKAGSEPSAVTNELAKVAQEAHNEIDGFREELFKTGGDKKLSESTFRLSEGANELKNAMGALVAYTGNPNPATLAHFSTQIENAKAKWNEGVDEIWTIAGEHGAMRLEASHGRAAAKAAESVEGPQPGEPTAATFAACEGRSGAGERSCVWEHASPAQRARIETCSRHHPIFSKICESAREQPLTAEKEAVIGEQESADKAKEKEHEPSGLAEGEKNNRGIEECEAKPEYNGVSAIDPPSICHEGSLETPLAAGETMANRTCLRRTGDVSACGVKSE